MSFSGHGDQHSEQNGSPTAGMRVIQFWIFPSRAGLETGVQQRQYTFQDRANRWLQIMGPAGEGGLDLAQDARALVCWFDEGELRFTVEAGRGGYLYVIEGRAVMGSTMLRGGDAVRFEGAEVCTLSANIGAELILIDVPLEFERVGVWRDADEEATWGRGTFGLAGL